MFSLALKRKEGDDDPWRNQAQGNSCKGVGRNPDEGHERFFSPSELAALSDALAVYGQTPASDCIRFAMLTGCRPGEAIHATWDQFDAEPGFWVKPDALRPTWALGSTGAIARLPVLSGIEALSILRERDEANRAAAEACGARWLAAGREVFDVWPNRGKDINDAIREDAA